MKTPILLTSALALVFAAGCSRHYVKEEKVVEKQPVVTQEREVIVEKPVVTREVIVEKPISPLRSCTYISSTFSDGSLSCQNGYQFSCRDGVWISRNSAC